MKNFEEFQREVWNMFYEKIKISVICHDVAKWLMEKYCFKTVVGKKMNLIYVYKGGIFVEEGKEIIEKEAQMLLDSFCKTHYVNEIRSIIERSTFIEREELGCKDNKLVCVGNGVLNIMTKEIQDHDSKFMFINKIPINFIPTAQCHRFMEFLEEVMWEDDIDCMQEWFGYCLYRSYPIKKAGICYGQKHTGKTQLLNVMEKFIGEKNCSGVSIQKLAEGKWHVKDLFGKYANICDELSERDVQDVNTFKAVTGGSQVEGEYKFGDSFKFINYAKLVFGANKIPYVKVDTDDMAYFDRWMPWKFEHVFEPGDSKTMLNVSESITNDGKEMSGILNWALEGLNRLLERKMFSYRKSAEEVKEIMQSESSSIAAFVIECCGNKNGCWISKQDLYEKYEEYCRLNMKPLELIEKFGRDLTQYCGYVVNGRKGDDTGWYHVSIISLI